MDILNEAWLTAILGIVDTTIDVVRCHSCFKGSVKYNFNPLKVKLTVSARMSWYVDILVMTTIFQELDSDFYQKLADKYDGVLNKTITFVTDSVHIVEEMMDKVLLFQRNCILEVNI